MVEVIAALGAGAHALFNYNRKNYMFDQEQRIKREYQSQDMRVKQFELYREDVRDLVGLTIAKMDNYLIVNTLQLGFCVALYTEGRLESTEGTLYPDWMLWLYLISISGAFLYLLMSVWLAMHASIAAHSFGVRLLTQFVRLPVPSVGQIDAARGYATDYEGKKLGDMLRVPIWKQQAEKLNQTMSHDHIERAPSSPEETSDPALGARRSTYRNKDHVTMLEHVRLYRQLQANWQSYDAYARVAMSMGTNQLLHALTYYVLGYLIIEAHAPMVAYGCATVFTCASILLARLDLYLHRRATYIACWLLLVGPLLAASGTTLKVLEDDKWHDFHRVVVPLGFLAHLLWIIFILTITRAQITDDNVALPTTFRSVLYLDVFGWYDKGDNTSNASDSTLGGVHARSSRISLTTGTPTGQSSLLLRPGESGAFGSAANHQQLLEKELSTTGGKDHWVDGDYFEDLSIAQMIKDCRDVQKDIARPLDLYEEALEHEQLDHAAGAQLEFLRDQFSKASLRLQDQICQCASQPGSPRAARRDDDDDGASVSFRINTEDGEMSPVRQAAARLSTLETDANGSAVVAGPHKSAGTQSTSTGEPVWLEIVWNEGFGAAVFYYDVQSRTTKWDLPKDGSVAMNLFSLERLVTDFVDLVGELCKAVESGYLATGCSPKNGCSAFAYSSAASPSAVPCAISEYAFPASRSAARGNVGGGVFNMGKVGDQSTSARGGNNGTDTSTASPSSTATGNVSFPGSRAASKATSGSAFSGSGPGATKSSSRSRNRSAKPGKSKANGKSHTTNSPGDRQNPAQETRFGGREGVGSDAMKTFANRPLAAVSFHPFPHSKEKRPRSESSGGGGSASSSGTSSGRLMRSNTHQPRAGGGMERPQYSRAHTVDVNVFGGAGGASNDTTAEDAGRDERSGRSDHASSGAQKPSPQSGASFGGNLRIPGIQRSAGDGNSTQRSHGLRGEILDEDGAVVNRSLLWLRRKRAQTAEEEEEDDADSMARAPPGLLPWKTFFAGSVVLVAVWAVGLTWSISIMLFKRNVPGGRDPTLYFRSRGQSVPFNAKRFTQVLCQSDPHTGAIGEEAEEFFPRSNVSDLEEGSDDANPREETKHASKRTSSTWSDFAGDVWKQCCSSDEALRPCSTADSYEYDARRAGTGLLNTNHLRASKLAAFDDRVDHREHNAVSEQSDSVPNGSATNLPKSSLFAPDAAPVVSYVSAGCKMLLKVSEKENQDPPSSTSSDKEVAGQHSRSMLVHRLYQTRVRQSLRIRKNSRGFFRPNGFACTATGAASSSILQAENQVEFTRSSSASSRSSSLQEHTATFGNKISVCYLSETFQVHEISLRGALGADSKDRSRDDSDQDFAKVSRTCASRSPIVDVSMTRERPLVVLEEGQDFTPLSSADRRVACPEFERFAVPRLVSGGEKQEYEMQFLRSGGLAAAIDAEHQIRLDPETGVATVYRVLSSSSSNSRDPEQDSTPSTPATAVSLIPRFETVEDRPYRSIAVLGKRYVVGLRDDNASIIDLILDLRAGVEPIETLAWQLPAGAPWLAISACPDNSVSDARGGDPEIVDELLCVVNIENVIIVDLSVRAAEDLHQSHIEVEKVEALHHSKTTTLHAEGNGGVFLSKLMGTRQAPTSRSDDSSRIVPNEREEVYI